MLWYGCVVGSFIENGTTNHLIVSFIFILQQIATSISITTPCSITYLQIMKLSIKYLLILSAIALASQQSVVLADEACCDGDADTNAEAKVEEAIEDGDAGKECAADDNDCPPAATDEETVVEEEDPKCPSRPHIIKCAAKYLDTNQNDLLERSELDAAMGEVHWLARGLLKVIGSTDAIMKKCDADGKFYFEFLSC